MVAGVAWFADSLKVKQLSSLKLRALPNLTLPGGVKRWIDPIGGDDGKSGLTDSAALKTFERGWAMVQQFDTLVLGGGGPFHEHGEWANKSNVVIQPAPGEQPWFEGYTTLPTSGWTRASNGFFWHAWNIRMDRDDPDNYAGRNGTPKNTAPVPDLAFYDGKPLAHVRHWYEGPDSTRAGTNGMTGVAADELTCAEKMDLLGPGKFFVERTDEPGCTNNRIWIADDPNGHTVKASDLRTNLFRANTNVTLLGIGFRGFASGADASDNSYSNPSMAKAAARIQSCTNFKILDCTFGLNGAYSLNLNNSAVTIRRCVMAHDGIGAISGPGPVHKMYDSTLVYSGFKGYRSGWAGAITKITGAGARGGLTDSCVFAYSDGATGDWRDVHTFDQTTSRCLFLNLDKHAWFYEISDRGVGISNVAIDVRGKAINIGGSRDSSGRRNTLINCTEAWQIYNDVRSPTEGLDHELRDCDVAMNVIWNSKNPVGYKDYSSAKRASSYYGVFSWGNVYYRTDRLVPAKLFSWADVTYSTLSAFRTARPEQETNSIELWGPKSGGLGDPLIDVAAGNYGVRTDSNAYALGALYPLTDAESRWLNMAGRSAFKAGDVFPPGAIEVVTIDNSEDGTGPRPPALPKTHTISDDMEGATFDTVKWTRSSSLIVQEAGVQKIPCTPAYHNVASVARTDFRESYAKMDLAQRANIGANNTITALQLKNADSILLEMAIVGSELRCKATGTPDLVVAYNATQHRQMQMVHTGSTVTYETSSDGRNWTVHRTLVAPAFVNDVRLVYYCGTWGTTQQGEMHVASINVDPPAPPAADFAESFENGALGVTVAGTTEAGPNSSYTNIVRGTNATFVFDDAWASTGAQSAKIAVVEAKASYAEHVFVAPLSKFYRRIPWRPGTTPDVAMAIFRILSGTTALAQMRLNTARQLEIQRGTSTTDMVTFTNPLPLLEGSRIEVEWIGAASFKVRLYAGQEALHSTTVTEERLVALSSGPTADRIRVGILVASATNQIHHLDDDGMSLSDWLGPAYIEPKKPSPPTFSPAPGSYSSVQTVSISGAAGATIYYTLNGASPNTLSQVYTGPLVVANATEIRAIQVVDGLSSVEAIAFYSITKLPTVRQRKREVTVDPLVVGLPNLISNPWFTTDANADGLADGWETFGDKINGIWSRVARAGAGYGDIAQRAEVVNAAYANSGLGIAQIGLRLAPSTFVTARVRGRTSYPYVSLVFRDVEALDSFRTVRFSVPTDGIFDIVLGNPEEGGLQIPADRTLHRLQVQAPSLGARAFVVGDYIEADVVALAETATLIRRRRSSLVDGVARHRKSTTTE